MRSNVSKGLLIFVILYAIYSLIHKKTYEKIFYRRLGRESINYSIKSYNAYNVLDTRKLSRDTLRYFMQRLLNASQDFPRAQFFLVFQNYTELAVYPTDITNSSIDTPSYWYSESKDLTTISRSAIARLSAQHSEIPYYHYEYSPMAFLKIWNQTFNISLNVVKAEFNWRVSMPDNTRDALKECISAHMASCTELVQEAGPFMDTIMAEETDLVIHNTQQWGGNVNWINGPALIFANGDVLGCGLDQGVHYSLGCGSKVDLDQAHCEKNIPGTRVRRSVVISQHWGEGYFHIVVEGLTRLAHAIHDVPGFFDESSSIHIVENPRAREFLGILGFHHIVSGFAWVEESILIPPPTPCGGHRLSLHATWLRNLVQTKIQALSSDQKPVLVVIKRSGGSRQITNTDELITAIKNTQEFIQLKEHSGDLPLVEQLAMFASASVVIGPHGAGLSNMVAMKPDGVVVELQVVPANHCYLFLAFNLGLKYLTYYEKGALYYGSWSVNVTQVVKMLHGSTAWNKSVFNYHQEIKHTL